MNRRSNNEQGVALVTTVIVVAVLAVVAVAFMQSTTVDRQASRSVANYTRAKLAAEAGAASAQALVADLVRRYPDSVTVWQNIGGGSPAGTNNEATVLYVRAQSGNNTNLGARPAQFGGEVTLQGRPLVSLATNQLFPLSNVVSAVPTTSTEVVNLNATNSFRPRPFVGLRSGPNAGAPVTAAQWIYLTNAAGQTNARFAFWVEDESFKVNVNLATNGTRADGPGLSPAEVRLEGSWGSHTNSALQGANAGGVISARPGLPGGGGFPSTLTATFAANLTNAAAVDELKFLTTTHSAGLDLSRGGFKRFNINAVTNGIAGPTDTNNIRTSLNRVIAAITNSNSAPNFGQRFYRLATNTAGVNAVGAVTAAHAPIYLQKIAANLLDYVDADDQPTYVNNNESFSIRAGPPDLSDNTIFNESIGGEGPNRMAAMGAEVRPYMFGHALGVRLTNMTPVGFKNADGPPVPNEAEFGMLVDHYFELWNPGTRDIVVGSGDDTNVAYLNGLFLQVIDAPGWKDTSGQIFGGKPSKNFKVNIPEGERFRAGQVTLLTTAPLAEADAFAPSAQNIVSVHSTALDPIRSVTGTTKGSFPTNAPAYPDIGRFYHVEVNANATHDTETQYLLGTPQGIVDLFPAVTLEGSIAERIYAREPDAKFTNRTTLFGNLRAGSPDGDAPRATEGDPRALMEQLLLRPIADGSTNNPNQTRFFGDTGNPLGTANLTYVRPTAWTDYSSFSPGASNAPMIVRNSRMSSVGELGHLIDPARVPAPRGSLSNVIYSRSGGRTLRVGQPEHRRWYDGNQTNASRTWTSWRLADIFTTTSASNNATSRDSFGNLTNSRGVVRGVTNTNGVVVTIPGLINPNGVLRDGGAALRATLLGMKMLPSPNGAANTANKLVNVTNVVNAYMTRLTNAAGGAINAYWERGEVSEVGIFNTNTTANSMLNPATRMDEAFDRGREELVRRSIEMVTTRGSIFTVYAIGQTLQGTNVTSTVRLQQTFQIEPQFEFPADFGNDNFDPNAADILSRRFSAPTNYTLRTISTTYD